MVRLVYSFVRLAAEEGEMKDGTIEISKGRKEQKKAEGYISLQLSSSASIRTAIITHEAISVYVIHSLLGIRLAWLGLAWLGLVGREYVRTSKGKVCRQVQAHMRSLGEFWLRGLDRCQDS